eukprot:COSAG04_NODE_5773_length_1494_cov_1.121602_2_plen_194_part_01
MLEEMSDRELTEFIDTAESHAAAEDEDCDEYERLWDMGYGTLTEAGRKELGEAWIRPESALRDPPGERAAAARAAVQVRCGNILGDNLLELLSQYSTSSIDRMEITGEKSVFCCDIKSIELPPLVVVASHKAQLVIGRCETGWGSIELLIAVAPGAGFYVHPAGNVLQASTCLLDFGNQIPRRLMYDLYSGMQR